MLQLVKCKLGMDEISDFFLYLASGRIFGQISDLRPIWYSVIYWVVLSRVFWSITNFGDGIKNYTITQFKYVDFWLFLTIAYFLLGVPHIVSKDGLEHLYLYPDVHLVALLLVNPAGRPSSSRHLASIFIIKWKDGYPRNNGNIMSYYQR